jgi:ribose transport system permease protein
MMGEPAGVTRGIGRARPTNRRRAPVARLRLDRLSGLYALAILITIFSIAASHTFPTSLTLKTTLADNSVTGLLALGALLPFAAGLIDLSFANVAGLSMIVATWLSIHTGIPGLAIGLIVVAGGAGMGTLSGFFITRLGVNSLVTTLGVSTVALGLAELVSSEDTLTAHFSTGFSDLGQNYVWIFPLPALYLLGLAIAVYYLLEHTAPGRQILAVGSNHAAARLAGLRVNRIRVGSLAVSGGIAGFAGVVLATQIGVATTDTGPGYLLPAIAALFLGETQIRARVNVWGTVLAVVLIGTGIKGLELLGAAPWVSDFFNGAVLLLSVGVAARARIKTTNTHDR